MHYLVDGFPHEDRCIGDDFNVHMGRHDLLDARKGCPDAVDHVQVDASPLFMTTIMTACLPSTITEFVCGGPASWTSATSRKKTNEFPTLFIGISLNSGISGGIAFVWTIQSVCLIFMSPAG